MTKSSPANQSNLQAWNSKAYALEQQGKYDEAVKAYDEVIKLDPNDAAAWKNKGNALQRLGRTTEADAAFSKASLGTVDRVQSILCFPGWFLGVKAD